MAIRIVGVDLPQNKRGEIALTYIYGIGRSSSAKILDEAGISRDLKVSEWTDDQAAKIRQMAEQMLQMKVITNPKDYMSVINTGEIESLTDDTQRQITLAKLENEKMMNLEEVMALYTDDHDYHIKEHANLLADPDLRFDKDMVNMVYSHIQEHITLLRSTDPDLLSILSQQPLGPQGGSPANQPDQNPNQGNPNLPPTQAPGQEMMPQEMGAAPENLPQPAQPPGPAANLPTNPADNIPQ